jgi:hypothetical protein
MKLFGLDAENHTDGTCLIAQPASPISFVDNAASIVSLFFHPIIKSIQSKNTGLQAPFAQDSLTDVLTFSVYDPAPASNSRSTISV